ncbi:MAG: hypothetical protein LUD77_09975 [Clostridiales bacterium]|nr:hypothetical protein [Clostridiales bacterium]
MIKYLTAAVFGLFTVMCLGFNVYAASDIEITSFEQASDGVVSVSCSISDADDSQRITVVSCEADDETYTEDVVFIDQLTPEISDDTFSFEFTPADWVTSGKSYILRVGGDGITTPAELVVVYANGYIAIAGDVNRDIYVNMRDVILLRQYLAGYDVSLG